ncbi:GntR family transcriptional regulator [Gammaproteobacteria bacterium 42_54_T18]|nr:GntR family transcriptional regulator [Gammaproteobacteria bacterium 42_54_T18]
MLDSTAIVSVREQIARQLRADIINGVLTEKTKLKEQELAARFNVSRGPVRDVLLQLTKEGLLISKNNCGVIVNSAPKAELQPLMVNLRVKIESHAIKITINELTEEDFAQLDKILATMTKAFEEENYSLVTESDMAFHRYIVHKAGGDDLVNLWQPVIYRMRMNYKRISTPKECFEEHNQLLTYLKNKELKPALASLKNNVK